MPSKEERVTAGLQLLRELQFYYEPYILDENAPYVAAAAIISGGPYGNLEDELEELHAGITGALSVVKSAIDLVKAHRLHVEGEPSPEDA